MLKTGLNAKLILKKRIGFKNYNLVLSNRNFYF